MNDLIYHYTSIDTFLKIVENRELWATDVRCCNDATETTYGISAVCGQLPEHAERIRRERPNVPSRAAADDTRGDDAEDDPNYWAERVLEARDALQKRSSDGILRVLAVCFSELPDALSQWRAYGGRGCAIGFEADLDTIIRDREAYPLHNKLVKLIYGEAEVERVAREIADEIDDRTTTSAKAINQGPPPYLLLENALTRTYTLKNKGFAEEKETRLVLRRPLDSAQALFLASMQYYVTATGLLVPHQQIPINLSSTKEVRVGPGSHRDDNVRALMVHRDTRKYRDDRNVDDDYNPSILASSTPYR